MELWEIVLFALAGLAVIVLLAIAGLWIGYDRAFFGGRTHESNNPVCLQWEDLAGDITRVPYACPANPGKGHAKAKETIAGYLYTSRKLAPKGFAVLSPGYGNTHLQYLLDIGFLCRLGYEVLAYDQYGTGMSSGRAMGGLFRGRLTLEAVLSDVASRHIAGKLTLVLYGHSWGGYSVLSVLGKHTEVTKAVARAPVGDPARGPVWAGRFLLGVFLVHLLGFFAPAFALLCHGPKGLCKAWSFAGENTTTEVLITRSAKDAVVPAIVSPVRYFARHPQPNVHLREWPERSLHNDLLSDRGMTAYRQNHSKWLDVLRAADFPESEQAFLKSLDRVGMLPLDTAASKAIAEFLAI